MIRHRTAVAARLLTVSGATIAGPSTDKAEGYFQAIATGNLEQLAGEYSADATLQWIGGPLDGLYSGEAKLNEIRRADSNLSSGYCGAHRP